MINFENIYKNRIVNLIDKIMEIEIISEKEFLETREYEYYLNVKNHYSLTCVLFIACERNMEKEFLEVIKDNLKEKFENFYKSYTNLQAFIDEVFNEDGELIFEKLKIVEKIDLVHHCYNINFYKEFKPYSEYKSDMKSIFLDAVFKGTLESIKIIFKEFL